MSAAPPVADSKSERGYRELCANVLPQGNSAHTETQVFAEKAKLQSWALNSGMLSGMRCYSEVDQLSIQHLLTPEEGLVPATCIRVAQSIYWEETRLSIPVPAENLPVRGP